MYNTIRTKTKTGCLSPVEYRTSNQPVGLHNIQTLTFRRQHPLRCESVFFMGVSCANY